MLEMTGGNAAADPSGSAWENHQELSRYLERHGVPIESFGTAEARTIEHLFVELTREDSSCKLVSSPSTGTRLKCRRLRIDFKQGRTHFVQSMEKFNSRHIFHSTPRKCREVDDYFTCMLREVTCTHAQLKRKRVTQTFSSIGRRP
jgi:hypothetical protein